MSQFKKKLTAFSAMLAFLSVSCVATHAFEGGVIGQTGNMSVTGTDTNKVGIDLVSKKAGDVGQVDWNNFQVGKNDVVNFGFSALSQTIINRVLGGQASNILGKLQNGCISGTSCSSYVDTGKVILINPAGVIFGQGSQVDLNSFTVSTFDIKGAKNLKGMDENTKSNYQLTFLNKLSPVAAVNGENRSTAPITFDSNYQDAFKAAGINSSTDAEVVLDGTSFNHFWKQDGVITADEDDYNTNKTIAIVSDNIKYKDSLLKTGSNYNYKAGNNYYSFGNISLVTADGATFTYAANGFASKAAAAQDTKTDVTRTIAALDGATKDTLIQSGEVFIANKSNAAGSDININRTIVKGTKMVNSASGDILITGSHDVNITNSRLDNDNTWVKLGSNYAETDAQTGGRIMITAGEDVGSSGNVNIDNSLLFSASSKSSLAEDNSAGDIKLYSYGGNVNVKNNSRVLAKGDADIVATGTVNISDSLVEASNSLNGNIQGNINVLGYKGVNLDNAKLSAAGKADLLSVASADNATLLNDINITNGSFIIAEKDLTIRGTNTLIDNSDLVYDNISFYDANTKGLNNVTVKGASRFGDLDASGNLGNDINLVTNGNFTLDGATLQRVASFESKFDRNTDGTLVDNGGIDQIHFTVNVTGTTADNVNVKSTEADVIAKNATDVKANVDINLVSDKGKVEVTGASKFDAKNDVNATADKMVKVDGSSLNAGHNVNVDAVNGNLHIRNNASITADNDVNLTSLDTITFANQAGDGYIAKSTNIAAGHDINVTSKGGDINSTRQGSAVMAYGNRLKFDAKGDNNFSSSDSLKSVNVDYVAGNSNNFVTTGDIQFVNSTLKSKSNNIDAGSDVILNDLNIIAPDGVTASTVKTTIIAKGDITTVDVTGTMDADIAETTHHFPQTVDVNRTGTKETTLDVNGTKLVAKTQVVKDAADPDKGTITLKVAGTTKDAGIELTAENVDENGVHKWDADIRPTQGPEVHLSSGDGNAVYVSKIVTDKLTLNTDIKAAPVELTAEELAHFEGNVPSNYPSSGYIEVRDKGGFNQDTDPDINSTPDGFDYIEHYERTEVTDENGNVVSEGANSHVIKYDPSKGGDEFLLVYEKEGDCPEPPVVEPPEVDAGGGIIDSYINQIKIPKEQVEMSKNQRIEDGSVDQSANIMAAAAKITTEEATMSEDNDKDDEIED